MNFSRMIRRFVLFGAAGIPLPVFAGLVPMAPSIADLQKQSDVIAEATLAAIDDSQAVEVAQLNLTRVI